MVQDLTDHYRSLSYWLDSLLGDPLVPRPALDGDAMADVAIVGAGYTGLWTAYYLLRAEPSFRVVLVEREIAGFGASGRNGGWCSALFPASWEKLARASSRDDAVRLQRAMFATVDEVGRVCAEEGIDVGWAKGGTVQVARTPLQLDRARAAVERARSWGFDDGDYRLLSAAEAREILNVPDGCGAFFTPHCAAIHPGRLVRGLARAVERRGGVIYERTPCTAIEPGIVRTSRGTVSARYVIRATEGFTGGLPGVRRAVAPVYSLMVATEPLPDSTWEQVGLATRPTFTDMRHMIIYGQRTLDGRLAFGGRGAPYHFGSRTAPSYDREQSVFDWLRKQLLQMLPALTGVEFTHSWGGPLGIARDWWASVGLDRTTGIGWAGGYVGDGVGTSNLAGRTLADLILDRRTPLTSLPWVDHRSRWWEPEPLRWLGVNVGLTAMRLADPEERLTGRPSVIARTFGRLIAG
ncbi:MAG TPA: FAD-binding oxidoreductase [Jiangellales bacterium]|nr:FAD-binding oxidoreductase [Jiangellales bacterium]